MKPKHINQRPFRRPKSPESGCITSIDALRFVFGPSQLRPTTFLRLPPFERVLKVQVNAEVW
jgi:hypothetical protein